MESHEGPAKKTGPSSPWLFYLMLGLIIALIAAFLVLHPVPSGSSSSNSGSSSSARPTQH